MTLTSPPSRLVDERGKVRYGMFNAPLPEVDLDRVDVYGLKVPLGRMRLKQWQHYMIVHPEMALTFAFVDAAYLNLAWVQFVDRNRGEYFEHQRQGPLLPLKVSRSLWDEECGVQARGLEILVHNHLDAEEHTVAIRAGRRDGVIQAALTCHHPLGEIEPLVVSLPLGRGRAMYSHKVPLPVSGHVRVDDQEFDLDPDECFAVLDIHKAHYPRRTWWNWATFAGRDTEGRRVALNLTRNVAIGDALHENALWIDGKVHPLTTARFEPGEDLWEIGTVDNAADLVFLPDGERAENLDYGVLVSRFRQPFGRFEGTIKVDGEKVVVRDLFGVCEQHESKW